MCPLGGARGVVNWMGISSCPYSPYSPNSCLATYQVGTHDSRPAHVAFFRLLVRVLGGTLGGTLGGILGGALGGARPLVASALVRRQPIGASPQRTQPIPDSCNSPGIPASLQCAAFRTRLQRDNPGALVVPGADFLPLTYPACPTSCLSPHPAAEGGAGSGTGSGPGSGSGSRATAADIAPIWPPLANSSSSTAAAVVTAGKPYIAVPSPVQQLSSPTLSLSPFLELLDNVQR